MNVHQPLRTIAPAFCKNYDAECSQLQKVDWGFQERRPLSNLEKIHPYPAKFIPEIPGTLLDCLPIESGTTVLDPFVGSGTTLVECQRRGISTVGIDLNPIACLISKVKTQKLSAGFLDAARVVTGKAIKATNSPIPQIPNLDHWFEKPIQAVIANLIEAIKECPLDTHDTLRLALSSILVRISNQDSDTRYAAIRKGHNATVVAQLFLVACEKLQKSLQARNYPLTAAHVIQKNTLLTSKEEITGRVGAVITSPPYPNAYEYWLYHKYRMWWLGYDPLDVKEQEIGARAHFFKKNAHTSGHFAVQMDRTFDLISSVLTQNGYAAFVVGRSKIHGEIIDNAKIIETVAGRYGFQTLFRSERLISPTRKSFNLSHANIKTETILVLIRH